MAYANFAAYKAQYETPVAGMQFSRNVAADLNSFPFFSSFYHVSAPQFPGVRGGALISAPSTAVACDGTTAGGIIKPIGGSGDLIVVNSQYHSQQLFGAAQILVDRLSHQGGLVMNSTSTQTTNLPTAALTRYTSGVGVYAAIEIYIAGSSTDAVWTVVYTNQAGTGSRSVSFIITQTPLIHAFIVVPLVGTDTGVKSVESVTLSASTGLAGNFGITLFKPLVWMPSTSGGDVGKVDVFSMPGWNTPIHDDACLFFLQKPGSDGSFSACLSCEFGES